MGSMSVQEQRLDELDALADEATQARNRLVIEACGRVRDAIIRGLRPQADDALVVTQFIAKRQQQNRYGQ